MSKRTVHGPNASMLKIAQVLMKHCSCKCLDDLNDVDAVARILVREGVRVAVKEK